MTGADTDLQHKQATIAPRTSVEALQSSLRDLPFSGAAYPALKCLSIYRAVGVKLLPRGGTSILGEQCGTAALGCEAGRLQRRVQAGLCRQRRAHDENRRNAGVSRWSEACRPHSRGRLCHIRDSRCGECSLMLPPRQMGLLNPFPRDGSLGRLHRQALKCWATINRRYGAESGSKPPLSRRAIPCCPGGA